LHSNRDSGAVKLPENPSSNKHNLVNLAAVVDKTAQLAVKVAATRQAVGTPPAVVEDYLIGMSVLKQK
jgi:hypothetical protein